MYGAVSVNDLSVAGGVQYVVQFAAPEDVHSDYVLPELPAKNPLDENIKIRFDFSLILASSTVNGVRIASLRALTSDPDTLSLSNTQVDADGISIEAEVDGGTAPTDYVVTAVIVTDHNQVIARSVKLPVREI